jgi:hypothetical protein
MRHRFKTWNILDCGLEKASTGFNYWEAKALADELVRQGETVRIFSHLTGPNAERFPGVALLPTFSVSLYGNVSKDPARAAIENLVVQNRRFHSDLARLDPDLFRDSLALFPMVTPRQLVGLFRWLGGLPTQTRPSTAINLFEPPGEWTAANSSTKLYESMWKRCPPRLKKEIVIFSRTPLAAAKFGKELGIPAAVFPFALPEHYFSLKADASRTGQGPMMVSFIGGARRERGCALIANAVKRCQGMDVQFLIQVRSGLDPGFDSGELTALSVLPHVRIERGALERDDYYRAIAAGVVLLPYMPSRYRWRDSGVYREAKLLDAPVLVMAGTWMANEVRSLGNGLIIEDFSADGIVECIARAQRDLPALRAAAARVGDGARRMDGVARCIEAVAGAFTSRTRA